MSNIGQYIVLSYGRSGSVLLAEKLGRATKTLPSYVTDVSHLGKTPVQHCHLLLKPSHTTDHNRIFNLRQDPVETVLSYTLAQHYQIYHQFKDQSLAFESFVFDQWVKLHQTIQKYIAWHLHYAAQLNSNDVVVFYEDMIPKLSDPDATYHAVYKNKRQLISNYDQVIDRINRHTKRLHDSQKSFVEHENQRDIYAMLNQ